MELIKLPKKKHENILYKVTVLRAQGLEEQDAINQYEKNSVILDLCGNLLRSATQLLQTFDFSKLRKLDLANNKIDEIPEKSILIKLVNLEIFYLHSNQIVEWNNLERLSVLPNVLHITLFNNPIVNRSGYRDFIINSVNSLIALDLHIITDEEKSDIAIAQRPRFRTLGPNMSLAIPFYGSGLTNSMFQVQELNKEIYKLKRIYEKNSPSILIQKNFKGYQKRVLYHNEIIRRNNASSKISAFYKGWKTRRSLCFKFPYTYLKYNLPKLQKKYKAAATIKHYIEIYLKRVNFENSQNDAAKKIQNLFKNIHYSKENNFSNLLYNKNDTKFRIYFVKDQRKLLTNILQNVYSNNIISENLLLIHETQIKYETIRIQDPADTIWSPFPIIYITKLMKNMKLKLHYKDPIFSHNQITKKSIYSFCCKNDTPELKKISKIKLLKSKNPKMAAKIKKNIANSKKKHIFDQYSDLGYIEITQKSEFTKFVEYLLETNKRALKNEKEPFGFYFEPLLSKNAAIITIQSWFRGVLARGKIVKSFLQAVVQKRASIFIQTWWKWNFLKIRLNFLTKMKQYCEKIDGNELLIEESLYLLLNEMMKNAENKTNKISKKFMEQEMEFGFIYNRVATWFPKNSNIIQKQQRYLATQEIIPKWLNIPITASQTQNLLLDHTNDLLGLIHSTFAISEIVPYSRLIAVKFKGIDLPGNLNFIKFICESTAEAKKRAYLIGIKTFNLRTHDFIKVFTPQMLRDPLNCALLFKMWKSFKIANNSEKVQNEAEALKIAEKSQWPAVISHISVPLLELDCIKLKDTEIYSNAFGNIGTAEDEIIDINDVYEQDKLLLEERAKLLKNQATNTEKVNKKLLYKELLKFKAKYARKEKEQLAELKKQQQEEELEEVRMQADQQRNIQKLVKEQHKEVYDMQLNAFHKILQEEKATIKSIIDKNKEEGQKEKLDKCEIIKKSKFRLKRQKEDKEFCISFMQIQNLINKQLKITDYQKRNNQSIIEKREKVNEIKKSFLLDRSMRAEQRIRATANIMQFPKDFSMCESQDSDKKLPPVLTKYEIYLQKRRQESERKLGRKIVEKGGGLVKTRIEGKKGKPKPAIFREELYPIIHKAKNAPPENNTEDYELPNL